MNTARGPIVDERRSSRRFEAGSSRAPRSTSSSASPRSRRALLALENVVLTPHLGSATRDTRIAMGMLCVEALRAVLLEGRRPANAVG